VYPQQRHGWQVVGVGKFGAWLLLMVISFILVSFVHEPAGPGLAVQAETRVARDAGLSEAE
jgi:hypothetical protein